MRYGVTESIALNSELNDIEEVVVAANKAAIDRLNALVDQEPASTSYVHDLLSRLHRDSCDFKRQRRDRAVYASETPGNAEKADLSGECLTVSDTQPTPQIRVTT